MKKRIIIFISISISTLILGCQQTLEDTALSSSNSNSKFLYVSSGACYSGAGNTTFTNLTSSNLIYRLNLDTGAKDATIADYSSGASNVGDSPASVAGVDANYIYALVENTTTASLRRVDKIEKKQNGQRFTFSNNITAFNVQLRQLKILASGDLLIAKNTGLEYITVANARIGAPFINPTAAPCTPAVTLMTDMVTLSNGKIVFLHANASQNKFGLYGTAGGTTCSTAQAAPNTGSFPTAAVYDKVNKVLIVSYAGNSTATDINSIYAYSINETTNAVGTAVKLYDANLYPATYPYLLYGISAMTLDPTTNSLYVATANSTATTITNYAIEKFTYSFAQIGVDNTKVLTRVGTTPFYPHGGDTKCISSLEVSD